MEEILTLQESTQLGQEVHQLPVQRLPRTFPFSILFFLSLVMVIVLIFCGLLLTNLPSLASLHPTASVSLPPLQSPGGKVMKQLVVMGAQELFYAQPDGIYRVVTSGGTPQMLATPGYLYNRSVPPLLTPDGKLIYSGQGIWSLDLSSQHIIQIVSLPANEVLTSLVLSNDGKELAWSRAPLERNGLLQIYAGPLNQSRLVYQHSASECPCLRVFSFGQTSQTLLLTNDHGDHRLVRSGLWSFDLAQKPVGQPQQLLNDTIMQSPLGYLLPLNLLLYSNYTGFVPVPSDNSAPEDISSLSYANSLLIAPIEGDSSQLAASQVLLAEQSSLKNSGAYHWVTTPLFTPDAKLLIYIEFSSDATPPFARHSALYTLPLSRVSNQGKNHGVQLLATATARYIELGGWMNEHTLSFYADNALYALDIQQGALKKIVQTSQYAHIIGTKING